MMFKERTKMAFQYVKYDELKKKLLLSIANLAAKRGHRDANKLIEDYKEDRANPDELSEHYCNISAKRRKQIGYLLTTIRCLDNNSILKPEEKEFLLNALACYVEDIIFGEYSPDKSWSNYIASFATDPNRSVFFVSLYNSLNLSADNVPSSPELYSMFSALKNFMLQHIYVDQNQGLLSTSNPYNETKIESFDWKKFVGVLSKRIGKLEKLSYVESRFRTLEEAKQGNKVTISNTGLGIFQLDEPNKNSCKSSASAEISQLEGTLLQPISSGM